MGGPYASRVAGIGGVPTVPLDVPICAVFMLLYLIGAASNFTLLKRNMARGHRFIFSGMIGGFCMARFVTCVLRVVWATREHNVRVAIAANIFVNAGILLIYILNLIFVKRMLLAAVPSPKLEKVLDRGFKVFVVVIILMLALLITTVVQSVYTLDPNIHRIDRDTQLAASTFFCFIAFLPLPVIIIATFLRQEATYKNFGSGTWNNKAVRLMITSALATLTAGFRCGTGWENPRPILDPAWYDAKWCFYVFNFTIEVLIVTTFLLGRVDLHFHTGQSASTGDAEKGDASTMYAVSIDGSWRPIGAAESERASAANMSVDSLASEESKK